MTRSPREPAAGGNRLPTDPLSHWPELRRIGERKGLVAYVRDLWAWREFAITVPLSQLRAQNQDTALGQIWHLLNPLFLIGIYYLIFGLGLRAGRDVPNYVGFLIVGVITFNYTRTAVRQGAKMIVRNRRLVQSIYFPRAILPLSSSLEQTFAHLPALLVMFVAVVATGVSPKWTWLLVAPVLVLHAIFNFGLSMLTARMTFHFRDVEEIVPYALRIWFYASGVLFPLDVLDNELLVTILRSNPVYPIIEATRDAVLYGRINPTSWGLAAAWSIVSLVFGFWFFRRAESDYGRV